MYTQERGKRTFVPDTREYHRLKNRKPWFSLINIVVVLVIAIALTLVFLAIVGKTPAL